MVKVKICGIKEPEDAVRACEYGADYLGFIFVENTPRFIDKQQAVSIIRGIRADTGKKVMLAGVFQDENPEKLMAISEECGLDMIQLQGEETPDYCALMKRRNSKITIAKTFKVDQGGQIKGTYKPDSYDFCEYFVFDTFHPDISGGTGTVFNWGLLAGDVRIRQKPFFAAGGLNPTNVARVVNIMKPYGVDVSSGIEAFPGKKDLKKLEEFIRNAKERKNTRQ